MRPLRLSRLLASLVACAAALPLTSIVTCTASGHSGNHSVALEGTYWQLIRLDDSAVVQVSPPSGAHLLLDPDAHRISGSGGCNRLMGSYEVHGDSLTFGPIATTRMACPAGMETETAFLSALAQVRRWKAEAKHLSLSDSTGKILAQFEVRDTTTVK
jgi:heat shock protein HslJ